MRCFLKTLNFIFNTKKASSTLVLITIWTFQLCANTDLLKKLTLANELSNPNQEKYFEALSILDKIEKQCIDSNDETLKILFYYNKGYAKFMTQDYSIAISNLLQTQNLCESINYKGDSYIESFLLTGIAYQRIGNDSLAEKYYRKGLIKTVSTNNTNDEFNRSSFFLNLGQIYKDRGDSIFASECFNRINPEQFRYLFDAKAEKLTEEGELLALNLRKEGKFEECLPIYDRLITRTKNIIGKYNEDYIFLVYSKAMVLWIDLSRLEDAKILFKEIFDLGLSYNECNESVLGSIAMYLQILAKEGNIQNLDYYLPIASSIFSKCQNENFPREFLYRLIGK